MALALRRNDPQVPLPAVDAATAAYEADRRDANIAAVDWSDAHFDETYRARWWPETLPVLLMAGEEDRIVWQGGWDAPRFRTPNVISRTIPAAGRFPWIENPQAVRLAVSDFADGAGR